jgi:putative transposase
MKRCRSKEEQIIGIYRDQKGGMPTAEVCRSYGISSATFDKWKSKFEGPEVSAARRMRSFEGRDSNLKKPLADAMPDNAVLTRRVAQPTNWYQKMGTHSAKRQS